VFRLPVPALDYLAAVPAPAPHLLVHGGGTTSRFWDLLVPRLDGPALAVDLPGRGDKPADLATLSVDDEVASVVADVDAAGFGEPIVVVAHSSGGLTVPGVLRALDGQVAHVVLVAASVPPEGGCGLDCMQPRHREGVLLALDIAEKEGRPLFTSGPPADPESFRRAYGGPPLTDEQLAFVVDPVRCVVDTLHHYLQPVHWMDVPPVPITYVATVLDRPVPVELQRTMAARIPAKVIELPTGHIPPIVDPVGFAALLRDLV
jgi:pimeloyl-ACP methyl ester carboxylesterase